MRTTALTAVFLAEVRTLRRLARSWLLAFLAVGTTLAGYLFFASMHGSVSSFVPSVVTSPRFLVAPFGGYLVWFVLAATVFLAFDIGNRERRERIADAIDTRPVSNIELLAGRLAGVLATVAVPVVLGVALIQGVGALGRSLGWDVSVQFEPVSLAVFLALDVVPAIVLWVAIVFLLAAVLRLRLVVAIVALGLLVLAIWGLSQVPAWLLPYVAVAPDRLVSDLVSSIPDAATFVHRLSLLLLAGGLLVFAATCLQRPDTGSRAVRLVAATGLVVGGLAGIAAVVGHAHAELETRAHWLAAQQAASGVDIDMRSVSGDVHIDPGRVLRINVAMKLALRDTESRTLLFRFNPGMQTTAVRVDDQAVPFEHRDGLLSAVLPHASGDEVTLEVRAHGVPNPDFAYLDSAIDHRTVVGANPLRELGTDASLFDRRYVALMPGVDWLPGAVASGPPAAFAQARRDFLTVDLVVEVPPGWLVAGPGRREPLGGDRYRFRPKAPVTEIVLLASDFHRVATTVDGIELELLLDPRHTASVEFFADEGPAVTDALTDIFDEADALGLGYPYDALSLVEVPGRLRGYRGGWRMETALALPGVLLLRERGFPTARFYASDPAPPGFPREKADRLKAFFQEDRTGADPLAGLARQLFLNQTAATGSGALALEYVCQALVARLLDDPGSYFSAHIYASSPTVESLLRDALTSVFAGGSGRAQADVFAAVRPPSVWQRALGTALADLDTTDPGQAVNILTLKGEAVARSMLDGLGRDVTARFVATLRERYQGNSFTARDFDRVAADIGVDLPAIVGDWLNDASLPGFIASAVETERLPDDDQGEPRYQLGVSVFNGEGVPGLFRLRYRLGDSRRIGESDPVRVPGHTATEVGLVTQEPVRELWVVPYLSLNRREFPLRVPETDTSEATDSTPLVGSRPSPWRPVAGSGIVVDDLDPGFSATPPNAISRGTPSQVPGYDIDQGLPVYQHLDPVLEANWSRQEKATSWGRYRHTIARITPGDGEREATFTATLPEAGRWRLDYHLPDLGVRYSLERDSPFNLTANVEFTESGSRELRFGNFDLSLISAGRGRAVEFDASVAEPGWTTLGQYDLDAGSVRLVVTNRTDGGTVVADAVRWTRVDARGD